mgnify:CR=1 FL=1
MVEPIAARFEVFGVQRQQILLSLDFSLLRASFLLPHVLFLSKTRLLPANVGVARVSPLREQLLLAAERLIAFVKDEPVVIELVRSQSLQFNLLRKFCLYSLLIDLPVALRSFELLAHFVQVILLKLHAVFQDGHPGFQAKYLDMLSQGGAMHHKELLAPFGLDASDPWFWKKGLGVVSGFIDELEEAL